MHQARKHFPIALIETLANLLISLRLQGEYTKGNCFLCQYFFLFLPTESEVAAGTVHEIRRLDVVAQSRRNLHRNKGGLTIRSKCSVVPSEVWVGLSRDHSVMLNSGRFGADK